MKFKPMGKSFIAFRKNGFLQVVVTGKIYAIFN